MSIAAAEVDADAGLPPETDELDASALNLEEAEEFADQVKYISVSRSGVRDHPYAFVVVGEVYVPGYMVRQYTLHVGDWMRGTCKVAPSGARLPYRATHVEAVDTMSGDATYDEGEDQYDVEDDMGSSDGVMPTGALRGYDDDQSDTSDDQSNSVARNLLDYIEKNHGELRLAGPPHLVGCLAHYYRQEPNAAETIKSWELADAKPGVHSFARSFPSIFAVIGRHPNQKIVSAKAQPQAIPRSSAMTDKKGAKPTADKHGGAANGNGVVSKAAQDAARRAAAKAVSGEVKAAQNTSGLLSKAAMDAAKRANGLSPKKPGSVDVQDDLNELRAELSVAVAALQSAQLRMERLEAAIREDGSALTSSAA